MLLAAFALGGGSRPDIESLIILRPLAALALGYAIWGMTAEPLRAHRFLLIMAAAMIGLVAIHLIPMPPLLWTGLPGRGLVVAIDAAAGLHGLWRPISLVPSGTWNALFAMLPPVACLLLMIRLNRREQEATLMLLILLGMASALLGLAQISGGPASPLYFYAFASKGVDGLFANRNHHAAFLATMFPMLAAYASASRRDRLDARLRAGLALAIGLFLVPLILVAGSRAGIMALAVGLLSIPFLYRLPAPASGRRLPRRLLWGGVVVAMIAIVLVTVVMGRALAFDRLVRGAETEEVRFKAWGPILRMAAEYFPIGSGIGSFREIYRVHEPRALLDLTAFGHAHNDPLELLVTGGLPAVLLLVAAIAAYGVASRRWWRARKAIRVDADLAGAGLWSLLILGLASVGDYPLRTPALACLFCVSVVWMVPLGPAVSRIK
ncbi:O-antigen polymerase [Sphingomonas sp. Root710]|uniref:O-antigen ligase family protein n=1 Tax=Sphingomonas sp. Root710 TaxID=1736594 RepID=UPI000700FFF0|nr:O-antigen ligase family protein [Sphingomonas sp. Root710]KRB82870.1 O-antigen polymerase [Sphingomonas sp. Root710]